MILGFRFSAFPDTINYSDYILYDMNFSYSMFIRLLSSTFRQFLCWCLDVVPYPCPFSEP